MALTQISTNGIKNATITNADIGSSAAIARTKLANVDLVDDTSPQLGNSLDMNGQSINGGDSAGATSNRIKLGAGDDLQIYHDASKSVIADIGTGGLFVAGSSISLTNDAITETMLYAVPDGAVQLYYDNSKKFETKSSGVGVTGNLEVGSGQITCGVHGTTGIQIINDGTFGTIHNVDLTFRTVSATRATIDTSGNFNIPNDSGKIRLGASQDLQIYHDGTNSYLQNGTGSLLVQGGSQILYLQAVNHEDGLRVNPNGSVQLFYDGGAKFETSSSGVSVSGDLNVGTFRVSSSSGNVFMADSDQLRLGTGEDFRLYHDGTHSYIDNATGGLYIKVGNGEFLNRGGNEVLAKFIENGAVELYYDNSKKFFTYSDGVHIDTGTLRGDDNAKIALGSGTNGDLQIHHDGSHSYIKNSTNYTYYLSTQHHFKNAADNELQAKFQENAGVELYYDNSLKLETENTGIGVTGNVDATGNLYGASLVLSSNAFISDSNKLNLGTGLDLQIHHNGSANYIQSPSHTLYIQATTIDIGNGAGNEAKAKFIDNGSVDLYYDGTLKANTRSDGFEIRQHLTMGDGDEIRLGNSSDLLIHHNGSHSIVHTNVGNLSLSGQNKVQLSKATSDGTVSYEFMVQANANGAVQLYYDNSLKLETHSSNGVQFPAGLQTPDSQAVRIGNSNDLLLFHDGNNSIIGNQTGVLIIASPSELLLRSHQGENMFRGVPNGDARLYYDNSMKLKTVNAGVEITGSLNPDQHNLRDLGASNKRWATFYVVNQPNVSDKNEKNTIQHTDLGLSFINKLNPVSFKWNDTSLGTKTRYGLIVQEVEEAIKELGKNPDNIGMIDKPDKGAMGLCTNELIAPLVKAIQELSAKVAALEAA